MPTIAVDVDEVTADLLSVWLRRYNADYNDTLTQESILSWGIHEFVKPECGDKIYSYLDAPDIYSEVEPIPGAQEGVEILKALGNRVIFVTAGTYQGKLDWLKRYGFITDKKDFAVCYDKSLIRADVLVDDGEHNFRGFIGGRVLYAQPWNTQAKNCFVTHDWLEVVDVIANIMKVVRFAYI